MQGEWSSGGTHAHAAASDAKRARSGQLAAARVPLALLLAGVITVLARAQLQVQHAGLLLVSQHVLHQHKL